MAVEGWGRSPTLIPEFNAGTGADMTTEQKNLKEKLDKLVELEDEAAEVAQTLRRRADRWSHKRPKGRPENVPHGTYPTRGNHDTVDFTYIGSPDWGVPMELMLSPKLTKNDLLVWWYLRLYKNTEHGFYLTNEWIATQLRLKLITVRRALDKLIRLGLVVGTPCNHPKAKSRRALRVVENYDRVMKLRSRWEPSEEGKISKKRGKK